jgi:hypothetical protein
MGCEKRRTLTTWARWCGLAEVIVGIPIEDMPAEGFVIGIEDNRGWLGQQKAKPTNGRHTFTCGPSHSAIDFTLAHNALL